MARVFVAEPFRRLAGAKEWQTVAGGTVMEILDHLVDEYPSLRDKLFTVEGVPRAHFLIYHNGTVLHREDLQDTPVQMDSEIKIYTILAGG